jgi:hypothetical protein
MEEGPRMTRIALSFLIAAVCLFPSAARAQVPGDANADSLVDLADVVYELNYLFRNGTPPVFFECGDPTADCKIDIADAIYLLNYLFKQGPDPEIVECGWSEPVNLGPPMNTNALEECVSFSSDGKRMVLSSNRSGTYGNQDIWYCFRDDTTQPWPEPINCGPNINGPADDQHPCISSDGNKLYFTAWCRPGGCGYWDIWISTWDSIAGQWGVPQNPGPQFNTSSTDWTPFISPDNSKLYLTTGRPPGGMHVSEWTGTEWGTPVWLGETVHETWTEEDPAVTADGSMLYFATWVEYEAPALFVSYWSGTEWGVGVRLPPHINYPGTATWHPWVTPDGTRLYFTSGNRPGSMGSGDLWVSERIPIEEGKRYINRDGFAAEEDNRQSMKQRTP